MIAQFGKFVIGLLLLFPSLNSGLLGQELPDSLVQKLETAKTDEAKAKAYLTKINFYYLKDEPKLIKYADDGIPFAEKCNSY